MTGAYYSSGTIHTEDIEPARYEINTYSSVGAADLSEDVTEVALLLNDGYALRVHDIPLSLTELSEFINHLNSARNRMREEMEKAE